MIHNKKILKQLIPGRISGTISLGVARGGVGSMEVSGGVDSNISVRAATIVEGGSISRPQIMIHKRNKTTCPM